MIVLKTAAGILASLIAWQAGQIVLAKLTNHFSA